MIYKLELFRRSVYGYSVDLHLVICKVYRELVVIYLFDVACVGSGSGAAKYGFYSCHNLFCVKGLCNIVVRAELKTQNLVKGLALGGEHNYRLVREFSDFTAYLPAVKLRYHYVEQREVGIFLLECIYCRHTVVNYFYDVALFFEIEP